MERKGITITVKGYGEATIEPYYDSFNHSESDCDSDAIICTSRNLNRSHSHGTSSQALKLLKAYPSLDREPFQAKLTDLAAGSLT